MCIAREKAAMNIHWNKRKFLRKKKDKSHTGSDWFGTPTGPSFHCFGAPIEIPSIRMSETRFYEPATLSTPPKPLFSLKPLDATTWLRSLLSEVFHTNMADVTSYEDLFPIISFASPLNLPVLSPLYLKTCFA